MNFRPFSGKWRKDFWLSSFLKHEYGEEITSLEPVTNMTSVWCNPWPAEDEGDPLQMKKLRLEDQVAWPCCLWKIHVFFLLNQGCLSQVDVVSALTCIESSFSDASSQNLHFCGEMSRSRFHNELKASILWQLADFKGCWYFPTKYSRTLVISKYLMPQ